MSSTASAAPTSIPHHERSSHHHETGELLSPISTTRPQSIPSSSSPTSASFSTSPPLVSPLYAGANRAFAAASTSPTSRWSNNNTSPSNTTKQSPKLEKEYFDGPWGKNGLNKSSSSTSDNPMGHHRRGTSGSISSSLSSLGNNSSSGEPTTPKEGTISNSLTNGFTPLGRVPSLPLSSNGSYEAAQKRLSGSSASGTTSTWGSLSSSFSRANNSNNTKTGSSPTEKSSGMGGLLRSFSISRSNGPSSPPLNNGQVANPISSPTFNHSATGNNGNGNTSPSSGLPALDASVVSQQQPTSPVVVVEGRGRKASVGQGGKRRPSPVSRVVGK